MQIADEGDSTLTRARPIALALLLAGPVPAVLGQTEDVHRGMDSLRQRVAPNPGQKGLGVDSVPAVQLQRPSAWPKLSVGMGEIQVTNLLGVPHRVESLEQTFRWHWEKGSEKGWVGFSNETRKVIEWRTY